MGRLGLLEGVLANEIKELRSADLENQQIAFALGKISKIENRSNGGLISIAIDIAIKVLKKESQKMLKEYETECAKR